MTNETMVVTISVEEYEQLLEDQNFLYALQGAGVDNWGGYDFAKEILNGEHG